MPKISVIVPVYNTEKYLRCCIDSILSQTYPNFELILVDDGSTDKSGTICDDYEDSDKRVRVAHIGNKGVSAARNNGIKMAKGAYLMFVDSDDHISPDMLEHMLERVVSENCDIAVCGFTYTYMDERKNKDMCVKTEFVGDSRSFIKTAFWETYFALDLHGPCNKLIQTNILRDHNILFDENLTICEDGLFSFSVLQHCKKIVVMPQCLYFYRQGDADTEMKRFHKNALSANFTFFKTILIYLKENSADANLIRLVASDFFGRTYSFIYMIYSRSHFSKKEQYTLLLRELYTPDAYFLYRQKMKLPVFQRVIKIFISARTPWIIHFLCRLRAEWKQ